MSGVLHGLLDAPPLLVYVLVALLVFGEAAVFAGFVLPGETAVVLGGVLAARHGIDLRVLLVLVVVAAIVGDSVGYEVGRTFGDRVLALRPLRRHTERLDRAQEFLRERGGFAVFLGRWTAFLRAVMPGLAGVSRMPYRRFLLWNAIGGVVWGVTFCLVGYLAGNSYEVVEKRLGVAGAAGSAVLVVAVLVVVHVRRHRTAPAQPAAGAVPAGTALSTGGLLSAGGALSADGEPDGVAGDEQVAGDARRQA
jgi:membrane protein DedA with SNARE-associated domain